MRCQRVITVGLDTDLRRSGVERIDEGTASSSKRLLRGKLSGCSLAALATIALVGAGCTKKVAVPDLKAQSKDQATTALTDTNLKVGKLVDSSGNPVTDGRVASQSESAGAMVPVGTAVDLTLDQPINVPSLADSSAVDALMTLQNLGLKGSITKQSTLNLLKGGKVLQQSPPANTPVFSGDTVSLTVASTPDLGALTSLLTQQPDYQKLSPEHRKIIDQFLK